jgi:hypothetical protein
MKAFSAWKKCFIWISERRLDKPGRSRSVFLDGKLPSGHPLRAATVENP